MLKKVLLILLIVLVIFSFGAYNLIAQDRGYVNSKTPVNLEGGRYTDAFGFTFDYPPGYELVFSTETSPNILKRINPPFTAFVKKQIIKNASLSNLLLERFNYDIANDNNALYFNVYDENVLLPQDFWSIIANKNHNINGRSTTVNGFMAMEMTGPKLYGYYIYSKRSAAYLYVTDENKFNFEKSKALLNSVLGSAKFDDLSLDSRQKCPDGMCTYNDTKNRFSLKYPDDMLVSNNAALQENTFAPPEGLTLTSQKEGEFGKNIEITYFGNKRAPKLSLLKEGALLEGLAKTVDDLTINGQTAISYVETPVKEGWSRHKFYYIYKEGNGVLLQNMGSDDTILDKVAQTVVIGD